MPPSSERLVLSLVQIEGDAIDFPPTNRTASHNGTPPVRGGKLPAASASPTVMSSQPSRGTTEDDDVAVLPPWKAPWPIEALATPALRGSEDVEALGIRKAQAAAAVQRSSKKAKRLRATQTARGRQPREHGATREPLHATQSDVRPAQPPLTERQEDSSGLFDWFLSFGTRSHSGVDATLERGTGRYDEWIV